MSDEKNKKTCSDQQLDVQEIGTYQHYEVELAKSEIDRKEPIISGFFILQYTKLRVLDVY